MLCFTAHFCHAQVIEEPVKRKVSLSIQTGSLIISNSYLGSLNDFKRMAPESELLDRDFGDFSRDFTSSRSSNAYLSVSAMLDAFQSKSQWAHLNPKFQIGISSASVSLFNGSMTNTTTQRIDTLTSTSTGISYLVDSIRSETYSLDYYNEFITIDASFIIGSSTESTWSVYGGLAVSAGLAFNAAVDVFYSEEISYSYGIPINGPLTDQAVDFQNESYRQNSPNLSMMFSLPLGLNLRLSKSREIWKDFSTFLEYRPTLTYFGSTQIDQDLFSTSFIGIGARYQLIR